MEQFNADIAYQWVLSQVENVGPFLQVKLMDRFGSAQRVLEASSSDLKHCCLLKPQQIEDIQKIPAVTPYQNQLKQLKDRGIHVVSFRDPEYPKRLLQIASFPILLFYRGSINVLHNPRLLAVVGTRNITEYGKKVIHQLISEVVEKGLVIVSGMARGVDAQSQWQCLRKGGQTIAVQAQGVERGHPRANQGLYENILQDGGCVISEFPFIEKGGVEKFHFPRRNRLISGLSDAVLVVEAGEKSGALITARYALDQNRDVYAIPGGLFQSMSRGCLKLSQQGAKVVTCSDDILEDFGLSQRQQKPQAELPLIQARVATDHFETPLEQSIYEICSQSPQTMDHIIDSVSESASFVSATITKMQLMGKLKEMDGRKFVSVS